MDQKLASYLELLRFAIDDAHPVPECIKDVNWHELLEFATKHAIIGMYIPVVLMKKEKLKVEDFMGNKPSDEDVMEWVFEDYRLRKRNTQLFEQTTKAAEWFFQNGFRNCILKGQGNALMYPDPLMRSTGDIDIWLEGSRDEILAFTKTFYNRPHNFMHVDFPMFKDTMVEVHFYPSRLFNPYKNKKLWAYFESLGDSQFDHYVTSADGKYKFPVPTNDFNLFFQLDHIFRHLIYEGIGLRQLIDYYYLLKKCHREGFSDEEKKKLISLLNKFNIKKFSRAVMYVMTEVLGLEEKYLYIAPHEKEGKFLLNEILEGGNFGKYEQRANDSLEGVEGHVKRFLVLEKYKLRLLRHYPSEAIWMPWRDLREFYNRKSKERKEKKEEEQSNKNTSSTKD